MIEQLCFRRLIGGEFSLRDLMEREIIGSGAEIQIAGVRLPDHLHAQDCLIKRTRAFKICDAQGHMAETSMHGWTHDAPLAGLTMWWRTACCRILGGLLERRQTEFRRDEDAAATFSSVLRCIP